jgi:membrane protease YdiL (CAAX protease family)
MRLFLRLLAQLVAVSAVALVGAAGISAVPGNTPLTLILGVGTAVLALAAYGWVVRRTERRVPTEVARKGAGGAFRRGLLIGFVMFMAVIANIALLGYYRIDGWGSVTGPVAYLGVTAAAAVTEELIFRGILFRIIEERIGTWLALALTGLLFGAAHVVNPHATLWGALAIAVEAGAMLGAAYAATRNLWVPIGLHFGWNFAEGGVFGADVSGTDTPMGLLNGVLSGPTVLSGGEFGPEASVFSLLAGVAVTGVFLWLARHRGNLVPLRRHDATVAAPVTLSR